MEVSSEAKNKIAAGRRYEHKLAIKKRQNLALSKEIEDFLEHNGFDLPKSKQDLDQWRQTIQMQYPEKEANQLIDLHKFSYNLKCGFSIGFAFFGENWEAETVTACHTYTKNKLCHIWNWAKEMQVRKTYFHYINDNIEALRMYKPMHLTLTLRREPDGTYKGQRFFGHVLLSEFRKIRLMPFWLAGVYGGEYGIETKKGKYKPGLHTHLHSFCLLRKDWDLKAMVKGSKVSATLLGNLILDLVSIFPKQLKNIDLSIPKKKFDLVTKLREIFQKIKLNQSNFKKILKFYWQKLTNSTQIHLEELYTFQRDAKGQKVYEYKLKGDARRFVGLAEIPETELIKVPVKKYVDFDSETGDMVAGVMECIKYHFKGDCFKNMDGTTDIGLMADVLYHTKNKRMYGRYGGFYKVPELSFNFKPEESQEEINLLSIFDQTEKAEVQEAPKEPEPTPDLTIEDKFTKIRDYSQKLYNPFTQRLSNEKEFCMVVFDPAQRKHNPTGAIHNPRAAITDDYTTFSFIDRDTNFRELMQKLCSRPNIPKSLINYGLQKDLIIIRETPRKDREKIRDFLGIFAFKENEIKRLAYECKKVRKGFVSIFN
jgi:hypothetical protein